MIVGSFLAVAISGRSSSDKRDHIFFRGNLTFTGAFRILRGVERVTEVSTARMTTEDDGFANVI